MLLAGFTKDEDVVKVDDVDSVKEPGKGLMNISLKGGRGISEAEGHHRIFEVAVPRTKRSLPAVLLLNRNLVIGILEVKFGEELRSA